MGRFSFHRYMHQSTSQKYGEESKCTDISILTASKQFLVVVVKIHQALTTKYNIIGSILL